MFMQTQENNIYIQSCKKEELRKPRVILINKIYRVYCDIIVWTEESGTKFLVEIFLNSWNMVLFIFKHSLLRVFFIMSDLSAMNFSKCLKRKTKHEGTWKKNSSSTLHNCFCFLSSMPLTEPCSKLLLIALRQSEYRTTNCELGVMNGQD